MRIGKQINPVTIGFIFHIRFDQKFSEISIKTGAKRAFAGDHFLNSWLADDKKLLVGERMHGVSRETFFAILTQDFYCEP